MLLVNPELGFPNTINLLEKVLHNGPKLHLLRKTLETVTHQSSPHHIEIPIPNGIHNVEQTWHSTTAETAVTEEEHSILGANCHTGVVSGQSSLLFML